MEKFSAIETIDHHDLVILLQSKAVKSISVIGNKEGWQIAVRYAEIERYLSAINSKQIRTFKRLDTAAFYLNKLGLEEITVKVAKSNPNLKTSTNKRLRPDRSEALKKAHAIIRKTQKSRKGNNFRN